ncbi:hypothetical protein GCM10009747_27030 [Agromyces humatus]|uniref:OmpR/PhoB-type domain-containing protein n=1 Tax=Agromyces humatus TaxID=279573 RepID=A0ABN2KT33_9MICO
MSVLGALVVDGSPISPRERAVLAALVLRVGSALSPDELADALWGANPPATWPKQVQIAVARLRRNAGVPPIETVAEGYRVEVAPDSIDAVRFERLVDAGLTHAGDGDPDRAESEFSRALELWRGRAYADLPDWPPAIAEAQRLVGLRAVAEEERVRVRVELGREAGAVAEAERLVQEAPLREPRWGILALALYRGGRQADALAAIREARRRLDDELGIDLSDELAALETAILRHDPALDGAPASMASADATCPYRGLDAFDVGDEAEFFGRSRDILAALARVDGSRFVALTGASGCGKSSLVRAGVTPALRRQNRRVEILLPRRSTATLVRDRVTAVRAGDVLVVDQFEELLHLDLADVAVEDTCAALAEYMHAGGTLLLTVRSDFLDECARLPHLGPAFTDGVHLVPSIGADGLREAIEGPARQAGLRLEPGLTELILRDAAGQAGALPLVSHALVETWLRRDGSTLTVAGYEESGGLSGAIAQSADRLYQRMTPAERTLCRSTMLRLVSLSADGSPVRRTLAIKSLHDDDARDRVLTMLEAARLVSADESTVVVSHEALADAWPRLRSWLEEDVDAQRTMHALANAAESWEADGRRDEDLARGARLQAALEWADGADPDLTATESAFLAASAEREASESRALVERARTDRRQNRRLRTLLAAAAALIIALVGVGTFAGFSASEAERQRGDAAIEALVGTALSLRDSERDVAALLAAEAYDRWPDDPRARAALMGIVTGVGGFLGNAFMNVGAQAVGAVIPGTRTALVATDDGGLTVRDLADASVIREIDLGFRSEPQDRLVSASGDGRVGAVLWADDTDPETGATRYGSASSSTLVVVDLTDGRRLHGPVRIDVGAGALALDHSGRTVAIAGSDDGSLRLVSTATGRIDRLADEQVVRHGTDDGSSVAALAFGADGRLYLGRLDDRVEVVDVATATIIATITVPPASAHVAMAMQPDGLLVAAGGDAVIAVDTATGRVNWVTSLPPELPESCAWVAASELAGGVYCAGVFGRIQEYRLDDGRPTRQLDAMLGTVGPIATVDDGAELVTIAIGRAAISRWRLDGGGPVSRLIAPEWYATGGYAFEGSTLLAIRRPPPAGRIDEDVAPATMIIDTADGSMRSVGGDLDVLGWASGGRLIAYAIDADRYRIIDAESGEVIADLPEGAYRWWTSTDGRRIYVALANDSVVRVDAATGRVTGPEFPAPGGLMGIIGLTESPDGTRVSMNSFHGRNRNEIFDARTGERLALNEHYVTVLLDDGGMIAFDDNRITRFSDIDGSGAVAMAGTAGGLGSVSQSSDGRLVLVRAADRSASLFELPSGVRLGEPFSIDSPGLVDAYLRPDGGELAVSVAEGIMIWDLDPDHQFEAVCRIAGRNLTEQEWRAYLPGFDGPQPTCG